jgi:hypothetical protein
MCERSPWTLRHKFASRPIMAAVDLRTVSGADGTRDHRDDPTVFAPVSRVPTELNALQRLAYKPTDTSTDTSAERAKAAVAGGAQVIELDKEEKWAGSELNTRHRDFQSLALPTELPAPV